MATAGAATPAPASTPGPSPTTSPTSSNTSGCGPVVAVGHSLGGIIVSALAVEHPDLVRAVVAVDPAYGVDGGRQASLDAVLTQLRGPDAERVAAAAFESMEIASTPPALRTWHRRRVLGTPMDVVADTLSGAFAADDQVGCRPESVEYLKGRRCPVLAVHANGAQAEWDSTTFIHPYSRHVVFEDCGHWLHQERPDEFNGLLLEWVSGLPGAGAAAS